MVSDPALNPADAAMERYARGDDRAFAALYDALAPRLQAALVRRLRDRELALDVLQKTFLQIHRARGVFVSGAAVFPWAFTIARRLAANELRARRRGALIEHDDTSLLAAVAPDGAPDRHAEAGQLVAAFERCLAAMPENQRGAFILLKVDGLSIAEAAEVLGVSETAVKLRAHRAYEALRAELETFSSDRGRASR